MSDDGNAMGGIEHIIQSEQDAKRVYQLLRTERATLNEVDATEDYLNWLDERIELAERHIDAEES